MDGGTPGARAVVLLHGARSSPARWVAHGLGDLDRFRWYLPEMAELAVDGAFVEHLDAYLREKGIRSAIFVGHSFGAHVAALYAKRRPVRCSGLILFNAPGLFPMAGPFGYWVALASRVLLVSSPSLYDRTMIERFLSFELFRVRIRCPLIEDLRAIFQPLLVIQSDCDLVPLSYARKFARAFQSDPLRIIRGDHSALQNRTTAIADAVTELVNGGGSWVAPESLLRRPKRRWTSFNPFVANRESEDMLDELSALLPQ